MVLEVHDGDAATRYELEGGPEGASCRPTKASPDVVLGLSQLGSIYLGGTRAEQHVAAGTRRPRRPRGRPRASTGCSPRTPRR